MWRWDWRCILSQEDPLTCTKREVKFHCFEQLSDGPSPADLIARPRNGVHSLNRSVDWTIQSSICNELHFIKYLICITPTHNIDTKTASFYCVLGPFILHPWSLRPIPSLCASNHFKVMPKPGDGLFWLLKQHLCSTIIDNNVFDSFTCRNIWDSMTFSNQTKLQPIKNIKRPQNDMKWSKWSQGLDKSWIMDPWRLTCRLQHLQQATVATKLWERIWRGLEMEHESIMMSLPTCQWFEWWVEKVNVKNNFPLP